jgi:hypothetical protein
MMTFDGVPQSLQLEKDYYDICKRLRGATRERTEKRRLRAIGCNKSVYGNL